MVDKNQHLFRIHENLISSTIYLFILKKFFIRAVQSSFSTPVTTSVLGWKGHGAILSPLIDGGQTQNFLYPFFSSSAPYTTFPILLQYRAPAHIRHGSMVTY